MRAVKNPTGDKDRKRSSIVAGGVFGSAGSFAQDRQREGAQLKRKQELEAAIEAAKGTPEAKPLVEEYRALMQAMNLA